MNQTQWLTLVVVLFMACGPGPARPGADDMVTETQTCSRREGACNVPAVKGALDSPAQPEQEDPAKGTQTGGSGENPCLVTEVEWSEVQGSLPQVGTWQGELSLSDGGHAATVLTVEQRGPLLRSAAEGCSDLQRADVQYTLTIDGVLSASRAGELFDQLPGPVDPAVGYAGLLATRIASGELEPGVATPSLAQFAGASLKGEGDAGAVDVTDAGGAPNATAPEVKLSAEILFAVDRATVNLDWVCIDCGHDIVHPRPLGTATLKPGT